MTTASKQHIRRKKMPDLDDLMATRLCDLRLSVDRSQISRYVRKLYRELAAKGLRQFRPAVYFGDEWFSPEGVPAIAVPFYLAHDRLMTMERQLMDEVEGADPSERMKLLRHEAGHCFDHAFKVSRTAEWRAMFGSPQRKYDPDHYLPNPHSRDFVINLPDHYAQSHPDEDFAETFAVWLDPLSDWRRRYARWPKALRKLQYVDRVVRSMAMKKPKVKSGPMVYHVNRLRMTVEQYYELRQRKWEAPRASTSSSSSM